MATHSDKYLYNLDGTISDGKSELINHLKSIEDDSKRKNQIDFLFNKTSYPKKKQMNYITTIN